MQGRKQRRDSSDNNRGGSKFFGYYGLKSPPYKLVSFAYSQLVSNVHPARTVNFVEVIYEGAVKTLLPS